MQQLTVSRRSAIGFTLPELLIGAAVTAFIVAAMADGMGLVSQQMESIRSESDKGPEQVVVLMTDMARYGWIVEQPSENRLDIVDAAADRTTFELVDGALSVTRPSGDSGVLLDGVASFSIDTDTTQRLREAMPVDDYRTWFDRPVQGALADSLSLETGLPVALGFSMPSEVPDSYDAVAGVDEHAIVGTALTLNIPMSYVSSRSMPRRRSSPSTDLSPLGVIIEPGGADSLVLNMQSDGFIVVGGHPVVSAANTGVAQSSVLNGSLEQ